MKAMLRYVFLCVILLYSLGSIQKGVKAQTTVVPADKTLYQTGQDYLKKSPYIKARLAFQTLMNFYPKSDTAPDALLAIGDSYYHEGGTENLLKAEDIYKNLIVSFPANPKAQDAELKIIALNAKMMNAPDSDHGMHIKWRKRLGTFCGTIPIAIMPQS